MTFVIITHVPHIFHGGKYYAYGPYVREMNIWLKYVKKVIITAPVENRLPSAIDQAYSHDNIEFKVVKNFDITSFGALLRTLVILPSVIRTVYSSMQQADHIHLRCPGNVGLIGAIVQVFFRDKIKTAKYAGNWDPRSKQPVTYRLQKLLLRNSKWSTNMTVLVYGKWEAMSANLKPFFTASYKESEVLPLQPLMPEVIKFMFVGNLSPGKNPMYAVLLIERFKKLGQKVVLDVYGDGIEKDKIRRYLSDNGLQENITLHGNQSAEVLKEAYRHSHFIILPSESEGWPKVIAEGMFWGVVPLATDVSCVPMMLDFGNRGIILSLDLDIDLEKINDLLKDQDNFCKMRLRASSWSHNFTVDKFETEVKNVLA